MILILFCILLTAACLLEGNKTFDSIITAIYNRFMED